MYTVLGIFDGGWWSACTKDATFEILLMLLAAGIIGWLLRRFWSSDVKKINTEWQTKLDKAAYDLNNAGKNNKNLKAEIEGLNLKLGKYTTAANETEGLKLKLDTLQKQHDKAVGELETTKKEFAVEHEKLMLALKPAGEIEVLGNRVKNLTAELETVKKEAATYKVSLDAANADKARLASSIQAGEADELRKKINRLETDLNSSRLMVTKYQDESRKMDERRAKLDEDAKLLNEQMAGMEEVKTKLHHTEEDLTRARNGLAELNKLRSDFDAMKSEKDKWQSEADVQARNAADALSWRDKAAALENDLSAAKAAVSEMETLKAKLSSAEAEKSAMAASLQAANATAGEAEIVKARINTLEAENTELKNSLNTASAASADTEVLKNKVQQLETELQNSRTGYGDLQQKFEALLAEKNTLAAAPPKPLRYDDLEVIEGIGPKIEKLLYNGGIHTFCQLAETSPEAISEILIKEGGENYRIHDPGTWPEQAALLCAGKKEEFEKLAAELKGGKRAAEPEKKDDLKVVEGIGPKIEELLNNAGIVSFKQLAAAPVDKLKEILEKAGERYRMHDPTSWPQQAALLAEGKMEEFKQLADSLKGGRIV